MTKPTLILLLALVATIQSQAGTLKDHISDPGFFDGLPRINHGYSPASPQAASGVAAAFTGDGNVLRTVGGVFAHESPSGVPNGGSPGFFDFRFAFFDSVSEYIDDPFLESPAAPNVFHRFASVSNLGTWLVPLGQSPAGHDYFYWEFDVEFLGIATTPGKEQLVSIIPEGNFQSGPSFLAPSRGLSSATGFELDWITSRVAGVLHRRFKAKASDSTLEPLRLPPCLSQTYLSFQLRC